MLNLIIDPWIPVLRASGSDVIRPDQIADADVMRLDWPRPDLNLACMELLIGLVYLAAPPSDMGARQMPPDSAALRAAMAPLAPAFNLLGDGARFCQDREVLEGDPNPPDMLFIDSAGASTAKKNADLMVKRHRYSGLPLPLAAMALFALQDFAPSGGAGNRTSMRGGGPMVTLVRPDGAGLWQTIWANVPEGAPLRDQEIMALPWMRPTETSENKQVRTPADGNAPEPETFFGQPRRLRLVENDGLITGVIQRPYGTNYEGWLHPLSPYYRDAKGTVLPMHPKPGNFGYRNWRGVILQRETGQRAQVVERWIRQNRGKACSLIVAGWAMDNMKPLDFLWSEQPLFGMSADAEKNASRLVEAAEQTAYLLRGCVRDGADENAGTLAHEAFFDATQAGFEAAVARLSAGGVFDPRGWIREMRPVALAIFDRAVLPGLADLAESRREAAVKARVRLLTAFRRNKKIHDALGLEIAAPAKRKESA